MLKLNNLSTHTIRFYAKRNIIPNITRDKNNNRLFDDESIAWFKSIKYLRETGMSLDNIDHYFQLCLEGDHTLEKRYQIILNQQQRVVEQYEQALDRLNYINEKSKLYKQMIEEQKDDVTNPKNWSN